MKTPQDLPAGWTYDGHVVEGRHLQQRARASKAFDSSDASVRVSVLASRAEALVRAAERVDLMLSTSDDHVLIGAAELGRVLGELSKSRGRIQELLERGNAFLEETRAQRRRIAELEARLGETK